MKLIKTLIENYWGKMLLVRYTTLLKCVNRINTLNYWFSFYFCFYIDHCVAQSLSSRILVKANVNQQLIFFYLLIFLYKCADWKKSLFGGTVIVRIVIKIVPHYFFISYIESTIRLYRTYYSIHSKYSGVCI